MKSLIKWKIYWWATSVRDRGIPVVTQVADIIRDKTWVYEDHKD